MICFVPGLGIVPVKLKEFIPKMTPYPFCVCEVSRDVHVTFFFAPDWEMCVFFQLGIQVDGKSRFHLHHVSSRSFN